MNNQNVEPATSKSDIVLVTLAVLCAVAGVIAFSLLTSQTLAVRLGALFGGLVAGVVLAWFSPSGKRLLNYGRQSWEELRRVVWPTRKETLNTTGLVTISEYILRNNALGILLIYIECCRRVCA